MYMPAIFDGNLFDEMDDWFDDSFKALDRMDRDMDKRIYGKDAGHLMKTDVRDMGDHYSVAIDLPGFKKDEVKAKLEDGYLTISASKSHSNDEKDKESGKYIRRERYAGAVSRTFYVGEGITQEDVKGKFEDGILSLNIPKKNVKAVDEDKYISIE